MFIIESGLTEGWVDALTLIDEEMPYRKEDFYNSIKPNMLDQNMWWYNNILKLGLDVNSVNLYASGFAVYSVPLLRRLGVKNISLYDYDKEVIEVNWRLNKYDSKELNFNQHVLDVVFDHMWVDKNVDLVLNTSCEVMYHFYKMRKDYTNNTIFCLQGTNKPKKGNINLPEDLDEFIASTGLTEIMYEGIMPDDGYERFMVIGK